MKRTYVLTVELDAKMPYDFNGVDEGLYAEAIGKALKSGLVGELENLLEQGTLYLDGLEFGYVPVCDHGDDFKFTVSLESRGE